MTKQITDVLKALGKEKKAALDRLFEFLSIASISTDPAYKAECGRAAQWAASSLKDIGFDASVRKTGGHPMVVGHYRSAKGGAVPNVLFYGHYDVQPPDPLELWKSPPFEPKIRRSAKHGRIIVARGASDDKGQVMTFFEAARAWKNTSGDLPVNVTVFLEGEEECGSPSLLPFLKDNRRELKADYALVCDTDQRDAETPAIITRLRGMAFVELTIRTANRDLHSGLYGGVALNPIRVLTQLLGGLHGKNGRVRIPGFYDGIKRPGKKQLAQWKALGAGVKTQLKDVGLSTPAGEDAYSPIEQLWARPTVEVNGIWGGYTGPGVKTVIPSTAHAKLSFRLVPGQDPHAVLKAFRAYVKAALPKDAKAEFSGEEGSPAIAFDISQPIYKLAADVLAQEFGRAPVFCGSGASIPIVEVFKTKLGMDSRGRNTGPGVKTVIPSTAHAKLSFRLVPGQDPHAVLKAFRAYVKAALPKDAKAEFSGEEGSPAIAFDISQPIYKLAADVLAQEFGRAPVFCGSGASIPIVEVFKTKLGMDSLLMGFALDDDQIHAPNEKYNVSSFEHGARAWTRLLGRLGESGA